jgi:hypothetical protein
MKSPGFHDLKPGLTGESMSRWGTYPMDAAFGVAP